MMGQLRLIDERKLYLSEDNTHFEVLNGDDFNTDSQVGGAILSYGKGLSTKEKFVDDVMNSFGISDKQIIWLKPSEIPRVEGRCCYCKELKSFQKWELKHYGNCSCNRCFLKKHKDFIEENYNEGQKKDFFEEMAREEKGRVLI